MINSRTIFVFLASFSMIAVPAFVKAQTAAKPKLSASAIQVAMVETDDVPIPAEFRYAVYEQLLDRVRAAGVFQKVYRLGDRAADSVPDLVILHTRVEGFKQGSETLRGVTTVLGASSLAITASVTGRDGSEIISKKLTGRVRFFGENLNVTGDLAKRIAKLVRQSFQTAS